MVYRDLLNDWWIKLYFFVLRPMYKLVFKWITGQCELLRITYSQSSQVDKVKDIEKSLRHSRSAELKQCVVSTEFDISNTVLRIQTLKNVVPEVHPQFQVFLKDSLSRIQAYNKIVACAEDLRKTKFSTENEDHEKRLVKLWELYNDNRSLPRRVGSHWTDLGFQGDDPATDFRGMGILGLNQLMFFAETYPQQAQRVLLQSHHPQYGFSFAIVGINITEMSYTLLTKRKLRSFFYGLDKEDPSLHDFHQVYCHLLHGFTQYWIAERPRDIMEFNKVRERYLCKVKATLKTQDTTLLSNFQQEEDIPTPCAN